MQTILCDSRITNVTVYARGAMITRSVQIPEALPAAPLALQIPKVSALALPGSFRASLEGGREVVSLRTELTLPAQNTPKGPLLERLQAITREQQRLLAELAQVESLQKLLASLSLQPKLAEDRFRRDSLLHKINGALAASQLTTSLSGSLDEQRFLLKDLIGQNVKVIEALQLEANQASTEQTQGAQVKTRDVFLHLSASGEANQLSLRYTIHAARWWPAYTARILASENRAHFSLDAFVAQASGEDWRDVALSLSTADLILDARLPELASLRFSKAQPAPRRSYRPPPKGLDALFQGYDAAFSGPTPTPAPGAPLPPLNFHPADLRKPGSGGIFSRLGSLIKSNVNDAINKAEDPEKMLNQLILEMNNQLVEAKKQVAVAIADEKRLAKQVELAQLNSKEFEKKHAMAVRAGDDALATEASSRKAEFDALAVKYQNQHQLQKAAADQLKNALRDLQTKLDEARRKKDLLIARSKRAEAQKTIQSTLTGLSDVSAFDTFDRMAQKVDQAEAEAEAQSELQLDQSGGGLDDKFAQLEQSSGTDDALAALKAKMGLAPAVSAPQLEQQQVRPQVNINVSVAEPVSVGSGRKSSDDMDF
jgi:phage shock protein A